MSLGLALAVALVRADEPASIVLAGKAREIVAIRCLSMIAQFGGAMEVGAVLLQPERHRSVFASPFWRDLVLLSVPSKESFSWMNCRVAVDLDDGRRIVVDQKARFVVVPASLLTLKDWKGPVRELTGPQATDMVRESVRLSPPAIQQSGRIDSAGGPDDSFPSVT